MVAMARQSRAGGAVRGCFSFLGDVFFFTLMFMAILLLGINIKETFTSLFQSVDVAHLTSSLKGGTKPVSVTAAAPTTAESESSEGPVTIEACSAAQMATIKQQLPSEECLQNRESPYMYGGLCSFSYATRCPQARWLHEFYKSQKTSNQRQAIYVGSSRGIDAVNAMRMLSSNSTYDKIEWKQAYFKGNPPDMEACQSRTEPVFAIPIDASVSQVGMHLLETSPEVTRELMRTHQAVKYGNNLHIVNAAVAATDGDAKAADGSDVKQYSLNSYVKEHLDLSRPIDLVRFQLGAEDAPALDGADEALANVNYMEFEYNWKGSWANYALSTKINQFKDLNFVCYWAGTGGNLWRITDCWQDFYDVKMWSRIACVKRSHHGLAKIMEEYFTKTLEAGARIQYKDRASSETSGRGI